MIPRLLLLALLLSGITTCNAFGAFDLRIESCPHTAHTDQSSFDYFYQACVNDTHISTIEGTCHKNGMKTQDEVVNACPNHIPYCVDCGLHHVCAAVPPAAAAGHFDFSGGGNGQWVKSPLCQQIHEGTCDLAESDTSPYIAQTMSCQDADTFLYTTKNCHADGTYDTEPIPMTCAQENPNKPYCYTCFGKSLCSNKADAFDCDELLKGIATPTTNQEDNFDAEHHAPHNPHKNNNGNGNNNPDHNNEHHNNQHHNNKHNQHTQQSHHDEHHHGKHKFKKFLKVTALLVAISILVFVAYKAIQKRRNKSKQTAKDMLDRNYNENLQNAVKEMEASDAYYHDNAKGNGDLHVEEFDGDEAPGHGDEEKGNDKDDDDDDGEGVMT